VIPKRFQSKTPAWLLLCAKGNGEWPKRPPALNLKARRQSFFTLATQGMKRVRPAVRTRTLTAKRPSHTTLRDGRVRKLFGWPATRSVYVAIRGEVKRKNGASLRPRPSPFRRIDAESDRLFDYFRRRLGDRPARASARDADAAAAHVSAPPRWPSRCARPAPVAGAGRRRARPPKSPARGPPRAAAATRP